MILLVNGAFGIGKTSVARALVQRLDRSMLFDPELIGMPLQRTLRVLGTSVDDFQNLPIWRRLTVQCLRAARIVAKNVVVPMTFSNPDYLDEVRNGIAAFEPSVRHVCLVAPIEVVRARLIGRGSSPDAHGWSHRRAAECCAAHHDPVFAEQIDATNRTAAELAEVILARIVVA